MKWLHISHSHLPTCFLLLYFWLFIQEASFILWCLCFTVCGVVNACVLVLFLNWSTFSFLYLTNLCHIDISVLWLNESGYIMHKWGSWYLIFYILIKNNSYVIKSHTLDKDFRLAWCSHSRQRREWCSDVTENNPSLWWSSEEHMSGSEVWSYGLKMTVLCQIWHSIIQHTLAVEEKTTRTAGMQWNSNPRY